MESHWARELFRPINRDAVEEVEKLIIAVQQLEELIADSRAVAGLHLNGDEAPWGDLLDNWLDGAADAFAVVARLRESYTETRRRRSA
jgi:hypothetical protein